MANSGRLPAILALATIVGPGPLAAAELLPRPLVRLTQVNGDGKPIGLPNEAPCPSGGCQLTVPLQLANGQLPINAIVTFVAEGIYVTIEPVEAGAARIHEFSGTGPAILFLPARTDRPTTKIVGLTVERGPDNAQVSVDADAYLRLEFAARPAASEG